jgi:hypothetical protein
MQVKWNVFDLESMTGNRTSPCCYIGSPESIIAADIHENPSDILSPWIYPESNQPAWEFSNTAATVITTIRSVYPTMVIAPIWRVDTRITGNPPVPTLTEDQVLHCLSIASSFGLPALFFQGDRAGFVQAAVPLLDKWRAGQPCSVPIQPVPPPTPHGLAARFKVLSR